jgi:hypothetical protein
MGFVDVLDDPADPGLLDGFSREVFVGVLGEE